MVASSYGRGRPRATKKKRKPKSEPEKTPKKKRAKALTRKQGTKRRSGAERPTRQKSTGRTSGAKRPKKAGAKRRSTASSAVKQRASSAVKQRVSSAVKAATPKRRGPTPRPKKTKPLTPAQKGALTRARRKAEREAIERQLAKLNADRAKLRNKGTKAKRTLRQKLNARLKEISKRRIQRKLVDEKLPRKTPREKKKSREELFEHFRARFYELHDIAERKNQLPDVDYRERRIHSEKNTGDIRIIRIEMEVTERSVETIMYKVNQTAARMPGNLPIWLGVLVFTGMGERLIGYGNRVLDAADPDASQFQTQGIESTGIRPTARGMVMGIENLLNEYAAEEYTVVYCEHIKLMNFARYGNR